MGLTWRRTARRIRHLKDNCSIIDPDYARLNPRQPPTSCRTRDPPSRSSLLCFRPRLYVRVSLTTHFNPSRSGKSSVPQGSDCIKLIESSQAMQTISQVRKRVPGKSNFFGEYLQYLERQ